MRRLLQREGDGDERAALAIELFARRAAAGIAAAATALAGLDALVFTGGIGEGAASVRSRICERVGILGVPAIGESDADWETILARGPTGTSVVVVHAREDIVIADHALAVVAS